MTNHPSNNSSKDLRAKVLAIISGIQKIKVHKHGDFVDYETHHPNSQDERADKIMSLFQAHTEQLIREARIDENQMWLNAAGSPGYVRYWVIQDRIKQLQSNKEGQ